MKNNRLFILLITIWLACGQQVQKTATPDMSQADITPVIPLPWSANFDENRLDGWNIIADQPALETTWKIEQGMLVQGSRVQRQNDESHPYLGTHIVAGDIRWEDYCFQVLWRNLDSGGAGLLFRYQDHRNYYRVLLLGENTPASASLRFDKVQNGEFKRIFEINPFQLPATDSTVLITICANHESLSTYINEQKIFAAVDSSFLAGKIGFTCYANRGLCLDDVLVAAAEKLHSVTGPPEKALQVRQNHFCGNYPFGIRGIVFLDLNQNGVLDEGENGIPNLQVSDGRKIVLTDPFGVYSLSNTAKDAQFVFICTPADFRKTSHFFHDLNEQKAQQTFNFPLIPNKMPDQLPAHFIQITDIHVRDSTTNQHFQQTLASLNHPGQNFRFIVATGDLVERGSIAGELKLYATTVNNFPYPVFSVIGNHDLDNGLNRLANFHRYLGPDYFAFDYANWHFICLNRILDSPKQEQWLEQDLNFCDPNKPIVIFQHYPPDQAQLEFLNQFNVRAVFSGHWHSDKIIQYEKIVSYHTPPFRFGGIDNSPAGFRWITIDQDTIFSQYQFTSYNKKLRMISPIPGGTIGDERLPIALDIPKDNASISHITYQLERPNHINEIGQLIPQTETAWGAATDQPVFDGEHLLKLTLYIPGQIPEKINIPFRVHLKAVENAQPMDSCGMFKGNPQRSGVWPQTLHPPLHLKWVGLTRGSIDFAAPVVADSMVFIATFDPHNLNTNYICAFDLFNGSLKWCFETRTAIRHSLVAGSGHVLGQDISGNVYALDLKRGELLWQNSLSAHEADMWLYATPVIAQNRLFAGNAHHLAAIDIPNGTLLWQKQLDGPWISSYSSPALVFDYLLIGANWHHHCFYALNASGGERLWEMSISGTHGTPLIHEKGVYWTTITGKLVAMDWETGSEHWRKHLGDGWMTTTPTPFDSLIITDSGDGKILAVQQKNGARVWEFSCRESLVCLAPYKTDLTPLTGSTIVTGSVIYFGASDGYIYALDAHTGSKIWEYNLGVPILSTPVVSGNLLLIAALDGNIYCFIADRFENEMNIEN